MQKCTTPCFLRQRNLSTFPPFPLCAYGCISCVLVCVLAHTCVLLGFLGLAPLRLAASLRGNSEGVSQSALWSTQTKFTQLKPTRFPTQAYGFNFLHWNMRLISSRRRPLGFVFSHVGLFNE